MAIASIQTNTNTIVRTDIEIRKATLVDAEDEVERQRNFEFHIVMAEDQAEAEEIFCRANPALRNNFTPFKFKELNAEKGTQKIFRITNKNYI